MAVALEICGQRPRAIDAIERALGGGLEPPEVEQDPDLRACARTPPTCG